MPSEEREEIIVECLELECVLHLVGFDKGVYNNSYWNRFDLLKMVLEICQIKFSHCLILRALDQRKH